MKTVDVEIHPKQKNKFIKGYPLLDKDSLLNWQSIKEEGTILNLYSQKQFLGKAYYGRQNKGYGWVFSYDKKTLLDIRFFSELFIDAIGRRKPYQSNSKTTAYRIFNGEGDGFGGITIDYLEGHYLVTWYSLGVYQFKDSILEALKESVIYKSIYQKKRFNDQGKYLEDDDFVCGERPSFPLEVLENGVRFPVYLNDGPMIGFFLDQKEVRKTIRDKYSENKSVLNTFSYTGAFSVYAALGGSSTTTSVDLANRSLPRTKELFEWNDLDLDKQQILVEDVFNYFNYAKRKNLSYDLVILDPPSFARSKKHTFSAAKDYTNLMVEAIEITKDNGVIVASTNHSGFDKKKFKKMIHQAFVKVKQPYEILEEFTLPSDFRVHPNFREGDYLKVLFVRKA